MGETGWAVGIATSDLECHSVFLGKFLPDIVLSNHLKWKLTDQA